jgi:hypothetical protein
MTQTKKDLAGQWFLPKRIVIASLVLLFCFANAGNGLAGEQAKAIKNVRQIKAQTKVTPQQRMQAVRQYLHQLSEPQLIKLSQELGGERFLSENPSSIQTGKMNAAGKMNSVEKMRQGAKTHSNEGMISSTKIKSLTKTRQEKGVPVTNCQSLQNQEIQTTLRSPVTRERYLDAVANYLLNTTK